MKRTLREAQNAEPTSRRTVADVLQRRAEFLTRRLSALGKKRPRSANQIAELVTKIKPVVLELKDLVGWLPLRSGVPAHKAEQKTLVDRRLRELGMSYEFGADAMKAFSRPGAPATSREPAVRALEMKRRGAPWKEIAEAVCEYRHKHDRACRERIRASVFRLEKFLRKYKYDLQLN